MRTLFLNFAGFLTLFDIKAPIEEKLEAKFSEESTARYVGTPGFHSLMASRAILSSDHGGCD